MLRVAPIGLALGLCAGALSSQQFRPLPRVPFPVHAATSSSCAIADVNLDGALDIALVDFTVSNQIHLFLNDGYGGFTDVTATHLPPAPGYRAWKVEFARIDPDPFPDLVVGMAGQNLLYLNDRTGKFKDATSTNLPADTLSSYGLAVGDVDNDGDNDIVCGNTGGTNAVWLNDRLGKFTDATATKLPNSTSLGAWDAKLADVDGDKDLDLFFGNSSSKQQQLYIQDSNGVFQDETATRMPTVSWSTRNVVVADVDGDGDVDAFYGNYNLQNTLLINDGKGKFTDETATRLPQVVWGTYGAHGADFDEDGDIDIACANYASAGQPVTLLLNGGKGVFTDATAARMPNTPIKGVYVRGGDLDQDGDEDLVYADYGGQSGVYFNHQGQLTADKAPMIGQTWNLDMYAQPGYATMPQGGALFLGIGPLVPRVYTPWGRLGILPPLFAGGGFALPPPGGRHTFPIPVPNNAALKNVTLWWQALHNNLPIDLRLTSVWSDTIQ